AILNALLPRRQTQSERALELSAIELRVGWAGRGRGVVGAADGLDLGCRATGRGRAREYLFGKARPGCRAGPGRVIDAPRPLRETLVGLTGGQLPRELQNDCHQMRRIGRAATLISDDPDAFALL